MLEVDGKHHLERTGFSLALEAEASSDRPSLILAQGTNCIARFALVLKPYFAATKFASESIKVKVVEGQAVTIDNVRRQGRAGLMGGAASGGYTVDERVYGHARI
jgi:hypothetical protein